MALLHQLFTIEELKNLDPKELDILKTAITHAIRNNREIQAALRREVRGVYDQLTQDTPTPPPAPPAAAPQRRRRK